MQYKEFLENNFVEVTDLKSICTNYKSAMRLYCMHFSTISAFTDSLCNGEILNSGREFVFQNALEELPLADKAVRHFKGLLLNVSEDDPKTMPVNLYEHDFGKIQLVEGCIVGEKEIATELATKFTKQKITLSDLDQFEYGLYLEYLTEL